MDDINTAIDAYEGVPTEEAPVRKCDECGQKAATPWDTDEDEDIACINAGCPGYMEMTDETTEVTW